MKQYIETDRLVLRGWTDEDIPEFARLNSDDQVMEYFLKKLSYDETIEFYDRIQAEFSTFGFGLYAVERKRDHTFIGYVGLHHVTFDTSIVEISWRLLPEFWGRGYATEAALACLEHARNVLRLVDIHAFTSLPNLRSERVMIRIGMTKVKEFDHPSVEHNHSLCRHVLYKKQYE